MEELERVEYELEMVGEEGDESEKLADVAPKPKDCRKYVRGRVAEQMPTITTSFLKKAKEGSVAHTKLLLELGGLDGKANPKPRRHRGPTVADRLLEWMGPEPKQ